MTDEHASTWRSTKRRSWIPATVAGRYTIERELGAGAAAVTVAAQDARLGRRVAIKILRPDDELDSGFSQRFMREARAAAAISHPNVVNVYDVGQEGDLLYLVMQFVDGTDLKRVIEREGALPWQRAVEIARAVLAGLAAIHEVGIVHRDIKPQNVLIGTNGDVKVTDFGVAHVERDGSLTAAGTTVGTAAYMAPEQAQGETPTPAADVYAVGVMLYEMVSGRLPFDEPTSVGTMLAHIQKPPPPLQAAAGHDPVPAGLRAVIEQSMMKDPNGRFQTASAMRRALDNHDRFVAIGESPSRTSARTTVATPVATTAAPVARQRPRTAASGGGGHRSPPPPLSPNPSQPRGFGATFVILLLVLALGLAAVAGGMWVLNDRPDLFGGTDEDGEPTVIVQPTATTAATETPTPEDDVPVIEPADDPTPTPTPSPEPTLSPTPTVPPPTPTEAAVEPPPPTMAIATAPPDDEANGLQIIEPIDQSTVPADALD